MTKHDSVVLLIGLPGSFVAQRLLSQLLVSSPGVRVKCLASETTSEKVAHIVQRLPAVDQARVEIVRGDATGMDFGMPGPRFIEFAKQIDVIHNCTCANYANVGREVEHRTYVGTTGEALELALVSQGHITRLVHWSSAPLAQASGGRAIETEWQRPASFRTRADEMRFRAELLMRDAMHQAPITVLRPTIIVGDSKTGEMDRSEPPYALFQHIIATPPELRLPPPGRGDQLCHFVPIDYVIEAGLTIANDPRSAGRTFHLADERPASVRRVFEMLADAVQHPMPTPKLPRQLGALLRHGPHPERASLLPRSFVELLAIDVVYDVRNTRELLAGTGIECPSVTAYLKSMLARVEHEQDAGGQPPRKRHNHPHFEEMEDPLDA